MRRLRLRPAFDVGAFVDAESALRALAPTPPNGDDRDPESRSDTNDLSRQRQRSARGGRRPNDDARGG
jgi:hypothetical protein